MLFNNSRTPVLLIGTRERIPELKNCSPDLGYDIAGQRACMGQRYTQQGG